MKNIINILEENSTKYKAKNALSIQTDSGIYRTYTYEQLFKSTQDYSHKIINSGITEGDRVALIAENSPEWIISYMSILYSKCTPVLLDSSLSQPDLAELIQKSDVRGIMMSPNVRKKLTSAKNIDVPTFNIIDKASTFAGDNTKLPHDFPPTPDPDTDIIAIIYSSGTTSTAKGVMFSSEGVITTGKNNVISNRLTPNDKLLAVIPLNHIYGFMAKMICPLLCGASVCFIETMSSENLSKTFLTFKPTAFCCVPRVFEMLGSKINSTVISKGKIVKIIFNALLNICTVLRKHTGINLGKIIFKSVHKSFGGSFRAFMSAGSILDKETASLFYGLGFDLFNNYGITETNIPIAANNYSNYTLDTCGRPFKGVSVNIREADEHGIGEILVKSPGIMKGYFRDEAATEMAFDSSGWFLTGDLGYFDKNQNLIVTGRIKENIVLDTGKKVAPGDIEKVYTDIAGVSELVVCGVPKNKHSYDEAHAFIVKDKLSNRNSSEIESDIWQITSTLPSHMRISKIHFIDDIQKTSLQKPKRYILKQMALSKGTALQEIKLPNEYSKKETELDSYSNIVYELISEFSFSEDILNQKTRLIEDLGFDSLSVTEFSLQLEDRTGINISSFLKPNITIGEIVEFLNNSEVASNDSIEAISQFPLEKRFFENSVFKFSKILFKSIYKLEVTGLENLPANGGYLICPNHETHLDAFFVLTHLPDTIYKRFCCLAKLEHTSNILGRLMLRIGGGIPVDRYGNPTPALARCYQKLLDGGIVLIHPEGTRTNDGELGEFKKGAAKLSIDTGLPIIPVQIDGGFEIYPKGSIFPKLFNFKKMKRYCLKVSFGNALQPLNHNIDSLTTELRNRIIEL
ncbi:MAG: AMP-binding protein [Deltaproteobacteria bacterium]